MPKASRGIAAFMLPGFRTLAAISLLAVAIVIFALGAAALLRVAHEDFATLQTWRPAMDPLPGTVAAREAGEPATPTLAALRIEPDPAIAEQIVSPPAAAIPDPAPAEVSITPRLPEPQTPPTVVAALPAKPDFQLPDAAYNSPRSGPLLMPEIATNDAPPVAIASLAPVVAPVAPDAEPLAVAPLPRPKPQLANPLLRPRIVKRRIVRRVAARPVAAQQTPSALEQLFGNQR